MKECNLDLYEQNRKGCILHFSVATELTRPHSIIIDFEKTQFTTFLIILLAYMESNRTIKHNDLTSQYRDDTGEVQIFALLPVIWHFNEQLKVHSTVGSEHLCAIAHAGYTSLRLYQRLLLNFNEGMGSGEED